MDTALRPPAAPPAGTPSPSRRPRRWLRWLVLGLALLLIAGVATGFAWVAHYQPLDQGSSSFYVRTQLRQRNVDVSLVPGPAHTLIHLWVGRGDRFVHLVSVRNDGAIAVNVDWVGERTPSDYTPPFTETPVGMQLDQRKMGFETDPFRPFTLEPHAEVVLAIRIDLMRCQQRQTILAWAEVPVEFSVFGVHRRAFLPMSEVIAMHGTQRC